MGCTCRQPAHCPVCNLAVRVPLTNLDQAASVAAKAARTTRPGSPVQRKGFGFLIGGTSPCPRCGHPVETAHSRSCVAQALSAAGVAPGTRAQILAKITFPEG